MEANVDNSTKPVQFVRCLKCNKILKISRFDTEALLDHIRADHPEIEIINREDEPKHVTLQEKHINDSREHGDHSELYLRREEESKVKTAKCDQPEVTGISINSEEIPSSEDMKCSNHMSTDIIYTGRYKLNGSSPTDYQSPMKRRMYRASIVRWRPAFGSIYCPNCGCRKRPLMKSRAERMSYNSCGACCILTCWPFCFLPCLFPSQDHEYLYCANCKTFLGLYDRSCNCIKPNRRYVEVENTKRDVSGERKVEASRPVTPDRLPQIAPKRLSTIDIYDFKQADSSKSPASNTYRATDGRNNKNDFTDDDLPSITINGKPVPPDKVARIKRLSKYSTLTGIDFNTLTTDDSKTTRSDQYRNDVGNDADPEDNDDEDINRSKRKSLKKRKQKYKET